MPPDENYTKLTIPKGSSAADSTSSRGETSVNVDGMRTQSSPAALSGSLSTAAAIAAASKPSVVVAGPTASGHAESVKAAPTSTSTSQPATSARIKSHRVVSSIPRPHFVPPSANTALATILPKPPASFQTEKLRKGKWTKLEEQYTEFLISEFEKGTLEDCKNGSTLRLYLSRKLHCAPMRVSKKYAGKGILKQVFFCRLGLPMDARRTGPPVLMPDRVRRQQVESNFYKSLLQEVDVPGGDQSTLPYDSTYAAGPASSTIYAQPIQLVPGTLIPIVPQQPDLPPVPLMPQQPTAPAAPRAALWPATNTTLPPSSSNQSSSSPEQLQQTYLSAPDQMKTNYAKAADGAQLACSANPSNGGTSATQPSLATSIEGKRTPPPTVAGSGGSAHGGNRLPPSVSIPSPFLNTPDIPDFLCGFEKVAAMAAAESSKNTAVAKSENAVFVNPFEADGALTSQGSPALTSSQFTPTFTSRSFDDFHRLLGNYCSPGHFDLNATSAEDTSAEERKTAQQESGALPTFPGISAQRLASANTGSRSTSSKGAFEADSYTLLAQQSALAVSQHSAYHNASTTAAGGHGEAQATAAPLLTPRPPSVSPSSAANATMNLREVAKAVKKSTRTEAGSPSLDEYSRRATPSFNIMQRQFRMQSSGNLVTASERSSEVGTEESESAVASSHGSGSDSNTASDGVSDNTSNDSDSNSEDGPRRKKTKTTHRRERESSSVPVSDSAQ